MRVAGQFRIRPEPLRLLSIVEWKGNILFNGIVWIFWKYLWYTVVDTIIRKEWIINIKCTKNPQDCWKCCARSILSCKKTRKCSIQIFFTPFLATMKTHNFHYFITYTWRPLSLTITNSGMVCAMQPIKSFTANVAGIGPMDSHLRSHHRTSTSIIEFDNRLKDMITVIFF